MASRVKRVLVGAEAVVTMVAGGLTAGAPEAPTRVLQSDDGSLILICYFEPRAGHLSFCDVYFSPVRPTTPAGETPVEEPLERIRARPRLGS